MDSLATIPSSPAALYRVRRSEGDGHAEAVATCAHAFGRSRKEIEDRVGGRVRGEVEHPQVVEPPQEITEFVEFVPDRFALAASELDGRVAEAEGRRQHLALDALSDPAAQRELADVERELDELHAEGERVALAKIEAGRRDREREEQCKAAAQRKAEAAAAEAGTAAVKTWAKVEKAAHAFAEALAAHEAAYNAHARARSDANQRVGSWTTPPASLQVCLAKALSDAGAPTSWCNF